MIAEEKVVEGGGPEINADRHGRITVLAGRHGPWRDGTDYRSPATRVPRPVEIADTRVAFARERPATRRAFSSGSFPTKSTVGSL